MKKLTTEETQGETLERGGGIMLKIVANNIVAIQPPKRRPTWTPTVCANNSFNKYFLRLLLTQNTI